MIPSNDIDQCEKNTTECKAIQKAFEICSNAASTCGQR